jgi:hypothetical protein
LQRVGYATVGIEIRGIPPFAKSAKDGAPGDLLHSLPRIGNAPFHIPRSATPVDDFKESRLKDHPWSVGTENPHVGFLHTESTPALIRPAAPLPD